MGSQFNIRDMPQWSDQQLSDLIEWTGYTKVQIMLLGLDHLWLATKKEREERMNKQARQLEKTLEQYLQSEDFKSGVIASTKASWGGSCYKVEIMPDGTWQNLWANQIGNRYETAGVIIALPALNCDDLSEFTQSGGTEDEYLSLGFDNERDEIESEVRDALKVQS